MAKHPIRLMIDFETPSLNLSTAPLTLAAVQFGVPFHERPAVLFYDRASLASIERRGFSVSKETMQWWDKQDPVMRNEVFGGTQDIEALMQVFVDWCTEKFADETGSINHIELWSRGADFDCSILQHVCLELWGHYPFDFRMHRCQRTLESLVSSGYIESRILPQENKHHALHDAIRQAKVAELVLTSIHAVHTDAHTITT